MGKGKGCGESRGPSKFCAPRKMIIEGEGGAGAIRFTSDVLSCLIKFRACKFMIINCRG